MTGISAAFHRCRSNRRLAAALVFVALLMQALAPYLPMPTMGGLTSWQLGDARTCLSWGGDGGRKDPGRPSPDDHCTICSVLAQSGSVLTPAPVAVPARLSAPRVAYSLASDAHVPTSASSAFASRAPPRPA